MNVLVVGGAGYIGSHCVRQLAAAGHKPVVLDNLVYGHRAAVAPGVGRSVDAPQLKEALPVVTAVAANPAGTVGATVSASVITLSAADGAETWGVAAWSKAATW